MPDIEADISINALLESIGTDEERRTRMRKIGHFAHFFGNVLPNNRNRCIKNPLHHRIDARPLLALPAVKTGLGSVSIIEFAVRHRPIDRLLRHTDLMFFDKDGPQPRNLWETPGIELVSLVTTPDIEGRATSHQLQTLNGPLADLETLKHVQNIVGAVLQARDIAPYVELQG